MPLLLQEGYEVRALYRSEAARERLVGALAPGTEARLALVPGDLDDFGALLSGMEVGGRR